VVSDGGACTEQILTKWECFNAAAATMGGSGVAFVNKTGADAEKPAGCSAASTGSPLKVEVFFNTLPAGTAGDEYFHILVDFLLFVARELCQIAPSPLVMGPRCDLMGPLGLWHVKK
jgi:hypothetical protein